MGKVFRCEREGSCATLGDCAWEGGGPGTVEELLESFVGVRTVILGTKPKLSFLILDAMPSWWFEVSNHRVEIRPKLTPDSKQSISIPTPANQINA